MLSFNKKAHSDRLLRWMFILSFWFLWLGLPFLMLNEEDERFRRFLITILPANLTNIPLFFLNTEWLAYRLLRKKGITSYLLSLLPLIVFFLVLQGVMKHYLLAPDVKGIAFHAYKSIFPVLSVMGISTGYALVSYLVDQEKARQEERQERLQSELSFLRSQISPHFIFNILNSIVYLIRSKSELAEPVTIKLSELMRYMLYDSNDAHIPLEKEVEYLKNYVELQKIRFEEDVDIRLNIEGTPASQIIEPLLMIPFVENAFKHGVGLVAEPVIDINLKFNENELHFTVRNKITPDTPDNKDNSSGIGLQNVRRRLELLYPGAHRLELGKTDGWFVAELWLAFSHAK